MYASNFQLNKVRRCINTQGQWFVFDKEGKKTCCAVKLKYKVYQVHRIIWEMFKETIPSKKEIDHLDGNPHNNILSNLFCKTKRGNARNKQGTSRAERPPRGS